MSTASPSEVPRQATSSTDRPLSIATWILAGTAALVLGLGLLIAILLPYGEWDALALGTWSRFIAEHWPAIHFPFAAAADYQRPLFYFLQGTLWSWFGFHVVLGRLLSFFFSVVLAVSIGVVAANVAPRYRRLSAALAIAVLLVVTYFEQYVAAGLTDIPMAAMIALTAAVATSPRLGRFQLPLLAVVAALAVLTKRSAIPGLAGLALAILIGPRSGLRRRTELAGTLALGVGLGLVYDYTQARYLHQSLLTFLAGDSGSGGGAQTATGGVNGNAGAYYAQLAHSLRRSVLLDGGWLGNDLRVFLWFALAYAATRVIGLRHRLAVAVSFGAAIVWAWLGPHLAGTLGARAGILGTGGTTEQLAVLVLAASLLFALAAPPDVIPDRLRLARLLVWAIPPMLVWAKDGVYAIRLLSPAWPPLVLLIAWAILPAFAGAFTRSRWLIAIPAVAAAVLVAFSAYEINNLGTPGWQQVRGGGLSGLGDGARMRGVAYGGDFDAELAALQPQVRPGDKILTTDSRLQFFYLDQIDIQGLDSCDQLPGHRIFVLLEDDELVRLYGERATSAFWQACKNVSLTKVDERPGAYAVFVNGPVLPPVGQECGTPPADTGLVLEFGRFRTLAAATALVKRALSVGFVQAKIEQVGCNSYRVVETGIPSKAVGESIIAEATKAGFAPKLVNGTG